MTEAETRERPGEPATVRRGVRRSPWPPAVDVLIAEWRARWPAAFTKPVPLAVGFSGQIKAAIRAEGGPVDRKMLSMAIHQWTMQSAYLRAVARAEMRRNLDGSEAGIPDDAARQDAQRLLAARAAKHAQRARRERERNLAAPQAA